VNGSRFDWNMVLEFTWRIPVFLVTIAIIVVVSTNWNRWEGGEGWQRTNDAYLESDLTPVASKVAGYIRALPIQDYERVQRGQVLAQLVDDDYRAAVAQAEEAVTSSLAQARTLRGQRNLQLANIQAARMLPTMH